MTKSSVRYPKSINVRVTESAASLVGRVAKRRKVDEATVVRWWLDELPEDYVPGEGRWKKSSASSSIERLAPLATGMSEFDRILGGGVVPGKTLLMGGERSGMVDYLLCACDLFARNGRKVYFASGEMLQADLLERARRLGITNDNITLFTDLAGVDVEQLTDDVLATKSQLVVLDTVQSARHSDVRGKSGSPTMLDSVTNWMTSFAQAKKRAVIMTGRDVKSGGFAGTSKILHLVDGLIRFDEIDVSGTGSRIFAIWMDGKSRQGLVDVTAYVEMTETGFKTPSLATLHKAGLA